MALNEFGSKTNLSIMLRQPEEHLHGRLRLYYEGVGQCDLSSGASIGCTFCCFRYSSGRTDIFCYANGRHAGPFPVLGDGAFEGGSIVQFIGQVSNWAENGEPAKAISSTEPVFLHATNAQVINRSFNLKSNQDTGVSMQICTTLNAIELSVGPQKFDFAYFRFNLVNCLFEPSEHAEVPLEGDQEQGISYSIPAALQLPLQIGGLNVFLRQVEDYKKLFESLWHRGGVEITAYAIIPIVPGGPTQGSVFHSVIEELCLLLSLANGTTIHYLELECLNERHEVVNRFLFHNPRLMRFGGRGFTHLRRGKILKDFIETSYRGLPKSVDEWNIKNAIELFTDAKAEGDLLELRGLKLANCLELLRHQYLTRTKQEFTFPEKQFSKRASKIRHALEAVLREQLPRESTDLSQEEYEKAVKSVKENCAGLNRISFRDAMEKMLDEVKMSVESEELKQVIAIRNHLVHQAVFHPKYGTHGDQYRFLETFVGRFLTAAIGYPITWPPSEVDDEEIEEEISDNQE